MPPGCQHVIFLSFTFSIVIFFSSNYFHPRISQSYLDIKIDSSQLLKTDEWVLFCSANFDEAPIMSWILSVYTGSVVHSQVVVSRRLLPSSMSID
jgi:hypothetical protein